MHEAGEIPGLGPDRMTRRVLLRGMSALPVATIFSGRVSAAAPAAGYLTIRARTAPSPANILFRDSILEGLAEQGFVVGRNFRWIDSHSATRDGLGPLAQQLIDQGVDAIVTTGGSTRPVIAAVAGRLPVVYGFSGDPVAAGMADSLTRPRGNTTGVSLMFVEVNAKRIQTLKEIAPSIRRLALISSPNHPGEPAEIEVCRRAVASIGVDMVYMPVFDVADLEKALTQASSAAVDALVALPDSVTVPSRDRLAAWALERRIPFAAGWAMFAESGGLMTYGPSVRESYRRVGYIVARVLAGAKPADIPIEQPSRFEMVVNMKTAKTLGIEIPQSILVSADVVIE